jgi:hypothetical protein
VCIAGHLLQVFHHEPAKVGLARFGMDQHALEEEKFGIGNR